MPIKVKRPTSPVLPMSNATSLPDPVQISAAPEQDKAPPLEKGVASNAPCAPPFLSMREAAEWLCVSLSTLKRMIEHGDLQALHVGKRRKIPASSLAAYVARDVLLPEPASDIFEEIK